MRFLQAVGAQAALLELESRRVTRTLRGDLNRLAIADAANATRSIIASARQVAAIRALNAAGRLETERQVVRTVAQARLWAPDATLGELAGACGCTRATVQRALQRLVRLAGQQSAVRPAPQGPAGRIIAPCDRSSLLPTGR